MTPDLSTYEKFDAEHREAHARLQAYIETDRSNGVRLGWGVRGELSIQRKWQMTANNVLARIACARRFQEALLDVPSLRRGQQYSFVTYTSQRFAGPYDPKIRFETGPLKYAFEEALRRLGAHWAGMIEAGFITRLALNIPQDGSRIISWHVHAIVWGVGERKLRAALNKLAQETDLAGRSAIHIQRRALSVAERQSLYICKFPLAGQLIAGAKGEMVDWQTGEIISAKKWLKKDALRTGDLARAAVVLRDRGVDQLMIAGGDGVQVYRAVQQLLPAKFRDVC
ncbi:hypothetical protein [Methylopila sp. M107]|uniref:hypothetical protein n=1 Tax=Methylopila sp. M107 TaxID=1101190 RepID=UPI00036D99E1|nr:hypothetical protein [Methylopila sp. M107]